MKVINVKINGMNNPIGYLMERISCSWKVTDTKAKTQKCVKIEVSKDKNFEQILFQKEGEELCQAGEVLDFTLESCTRYFVRVTVTTDLDETEVSEPVYFETAKLDENWTGKWITSEEEDTYHPIFVKEFSAKKKVTSARLYISGLGLFTARLNGRKIGEEVLTPYYSSYRDEIQYITYDITDAVAERKEESNQIEVSLGNGWYKGRFGLSGKNENFGDRFQMIADICLTYEDGTTETIGTDNSWKYYGTTLNPVICMMENV